MFSHQLTNITSKKQAKTNLSGVVGNKHIYKDDLDIYKDIYNHGHNILELCNILEKFQFAKSKAVVDISYKTLHTSCLKSSWTKLRKLGNIR